MHYAGDPVHNKDLVAGKLFGPVQRGQGLLHPTASPQQRDRMRVLSSQQGDYA
jgi:hypothetical protein